MKYQSDIELENGFKKGDERAYKVIFDKFYRPLLMFAHAIVMDEQEAEDIVVETMLKLWKLHQNFDSLANIRAFLYITVRNQCFNYLRREKIKSKYVVEATYLQQAESEAFVLEWMIELELFEMIRREIDSLSRQKRTVLTSFYFENLSVKEIAAKLQLSPNTVDVTKSQAIKQLKINLFKKRLFAIIPMILGLRQN